MATMDERERRFCRGFMICGAALAGSFLILFFGAWLDAHGVAPLRFLHRSQEYDNLLNPLIAVMSIITWAFIFRYRRL